MATRLLPTHAITVRARFWRVLAPRWAHDPLSGAGAARYGGRWNPRDVPALYMSAELTTAVAEYEQDLGIRPGTFCAYDVDVAGVLDLRQADMLNACEIDRSVSFAPWKTMLLVDGREPPAWALVVRLIAAGIAGILVPSTRLAGGTNLVLWRWNDAPDRRVAALDPQHDLPTDQLSWPVAPPPPLR
jgi:RES domain-containing protein